MVPNGAFQGHKLKRQYMDTITDDEEKDKLIRLYDMLKQAPVVELKNQKREKDNNKKKGRETQSSLFSTT